ncbi:MAG: helix-turn-helix domain-containing protein [Gammaproteobacteria bacterium]
MPKRDAKTHTLKELGILNPRPERIAAPLFQTSPFFDPRDLVQVKYEMLRRVRVEGAAKAETAVLFGVSRPTLYQAEAAFSKTGFAGLLPRQRGPKRAHKLDATVMHFIEECLEEEGTLSARTLAERLKKDLSITVHPRSIERALARKKKQRMPDR